MSDHDPPFDADLEQRYDDARNRWRGDRAIVGIDIGFVYDSRGRPTGAIGVRVHRRTDGSISPLASVSGSAEQPVLPPREHDGQLRPGARVANPRCTFGTLGLVVFDTATNRPLIMSSSHVLGCPGTSVGDAISIVSAGTRGPRVVATFVRAVNGVIGDAAVAQPVGSPAIDLPQPGARAVTIARAAMPRLGDVVEKVGAATGRTCGVVDGLGRYFFSGDPNGVLGFRIVRAMPNCTKDIAQSGDCGAAWYRQADNVGVGLHIGSDHSIATMARQPAIACYLPLVLDALSVRLTATG